MATYQAEMHGVFTHMGNDFDPPLAIFGSVVEAQAWIDSQAAADEFDAEDVFIAWTSVTGTYDNHDDDKEDPGDNAM